MKKRGWIAAGMMLDKWIVWGPIPRLHRLGNLAARLSVSPTMTSTSPLPPAVRVDHKGLKATTLQYHGAIPKLYSTIAADCTNGKVGR